MTEEAIIQSLKEGGLRITPQRLAIIDVLLEKGLLHPGAKFIYKEAKKKCKSLCLSTTYATINEFSRLGIIKTLQFEWAENRCEGNLDEHFNLICERCGGIIDYYVATYIDKTDVIKKTGFIITKNRLEYYGYCRECSNGNGRSSPDQKTTIKYL
jgi:Fur family peroxide stress response transcriptional regulator